MGHRGFGCLVEVKVVHPIVVFEFENEVIGAGFDDFFDGSGGSVGIFEIRGVLMGCREYNGQCRHQRAKYTSDG